MSNEGMKIDFEPIILLLVVLISGIVFHWSFYCWSILKFLHQIHSFWDSVLKVLQILHQSLYEMTTYEEDWIMGMMVAQVA